MAFRRLGGYGQSYVVRRLGGYGQSYGGGYGAEADPLAAAILGALGMGLQTFDMVRGIRQERADRRAEAAREQAEAERRTMLDERDNARYQEQRSDAILAEARADRRDREREKRTTDRENANYLRNRGISVIPNGMGGTTYTKVAQTDDELAAAVADRQAVERLRQQAKALGIPDAAQMTRGELEILTSAALAQRKSDAELSDFKRRAQYEDALARGRAAEAAAMRPSGAAPVITQGERQGTALYQFAEPAAKRVMERYANGFEASGTDKFAEAGKSMGPDLLFNWMQSDDGQQMYDDLTSVVLATQYGLSGKAVTEHEARRLARNLMPAVGDKPGRRAQKMMEVNNRMRILSTMAGRGVDPKAPAALPETSDDARGAGYDVGHLR